MNRPNLNPLLKVPPSPVVWSARRIPRSHGRHVCGQVPVAPTSYAIAVESRLERDIVVLLTNEGGFRFIQSQPFTVRFVEDGRRCRYTPDLLVLFDPVPRRLRTWGFTTWTVVEVKPASLWDSDREWIQRRLSRVTERMGLAAVCLTERNLDKGGRPS